MDLQIFMVGAVIAFTWFILN
ncbi:hypothetical protein Anas_11064, partial [Armadillidium nasatum]